MSSIDLAYQQALDAEREALNPDPGTTVRTSTRRKGVVTVASTTSPSCRVDDLPAFNTTGWKLAVGEVVWLEVNQGRRFVTGVTTIKES